MPVGANYASVTGPYIAGVGEDVEFEIEVEEGVEATYILSLEDTSGNSVGDISDDYYGTVNGSTTITATMPDEAGTYTLYATFAFDDDTIRYKEWEITVVEPFVFSTTIVNDGDMDVSNMTVSFLVDDELIGTTTVNVTAGSSAEASYEWLTTDLASGEHTLDIILDSDSDFITLYTGGRSYTTAFYVGQQDYGTTNWIMGIVLALMGLGLIWVYRKPVKNYGRPKGRKKR